MTCVMNASYINKKGIEDHVVLKHRIDSRRFTCKVCSKEFSMPALLRKHELIHLPNDIRLIHPCPHCDKK